MPKAKNSPVLTCDICDFKATNGYIFKRHLHRCFSLHGIASKRSSSRNPIRLKGTEGLLSKDSVQEDAKDLPSHIRVSHDEAHQLQQDTKDELGQYEGEAEEIKKQIFSSPYLGSSSSHMSTTQPEVSLEGHLDYLSTSESTAANDGSLLMPGAPYSRQYNCSSCTYECKSARDYLLHQRNIHGRKIKIYACSVCDYASRYGNKVERHLLVHNKLVVNADDQSKKIAVIELTSPVPESPPKPGSAEVLVSDSKEPSVERPKVQPLKLKRLNIRMPFKVSGGSKLKSGSKFTSGKWNNGRAISETSDLDPRMSSQSDREVYRLVLSDDGSQRYQCQDCLYYASTPSSVTKHHALCHSRLLCCPHCSLTTTGQGIFYEHLITHEGHGYIKCPDCSYVTNAKSNYEKHRSFHNGEFPVRCVVCSFGADTESKIKRHVATQHVPPNVGEQSTLGEDKVAHHSSGMTSDLPGQGNYDSNTISYETAAEEDNIQAVDKTMGKVGAQGGGDPQTEYRCPKCPMVCYRRGNFTRHLTAKHKFNQTSAASLSKSMESQIFRGLKQKRSASSFSGLKQMRLQTVENLKCSHCSYIAKWPSDLRRHMQVHTLVKRFKCSICTNKYKYLGDLNVHMRRDHNVEPPETVAREVTTSDALTKASPAVFRCPICPFTSHSKAELEQHSRNHGNTEKTYQCRLCEYQTYWRGDVSRHLFRHHEIVLSKEATEIGKYFLHRVDIKPLAKQGAPSLAGSMSPSPSPDPTKSSSADSQAVTPEFVKDDAQSSSSGTKKASAGPGPVYLKEGSFVCEYPKCEFKTSISDRMETHMAVHLNLKLFMCPTCGKRTNWKWDVVKHMNKVHMNAAAAIEDVITLSIDEAKASIQDYLTNHEKKSKDLTVNYCSLCTFRSLEKNRVVRHMGTIHRNENGKVISQTMFGSREFDMSDLQDETEAAGEEKELFLDDYPEELPVLKFIEPSSDELAGLEKPYACAICHKRGSTKGDIKKHYNYTHPYKNVRIVYLGDGTEFNYYTGEIYHKSARSDQSLDLPEMKGNLPPMSPTGKILRPDSKFSNPKMHGYVKPFKCSICGLRSNWKWDLKKHLRSKHPNDGGFVILLSIEEASETYGKDCTPSHPKNEDFLSIPSTSSSPAPSLTPPIPSPVPMIDHVFKAPPSIKAEVLNDSSGNDTRDEFGSLSAFFPQSPPSSLSPLPRRHRGRERSTSVDPSRRQWKCSGCNYITNWRRNMARHIHRKHIGEEDKIRVVALHKETSESLKDSMQKYLTQDKELVDSEDPSFSDQPLELESKPNLTQTDMKLWNCPQCDFSSSLRTHIIIHMQQHEMKPFYCGVCSMPFMNRGPLHRHLQKIHKRSDYLKLCKVNIKYNDEVEDMDVEMNRDAYINSYFCRLCNLESVSRQEVVRHLEEVHSTAESENNILKIQKHIGGSAKKRAALARFAKNDSQKLNRKFHHCTLCPFRSPKKSMLAFHMTYHKPSTTNRYKCKHCPYYVSALRLLHQHQRKWHKEPGSKIQWEQEGQATPSTSPTKVYVSSSSPVGTPRRHCCEKCPYTTNSKNDFIYHKQFHRPKRTAEFKCEYCDYWVVHKRLLKQHMRLHTGASSQGPSVDISPAKSLYSDPGLVYDPVELAELAAIKQKMISAKITASLSKSPNISPMKIASQCSVDSKPGYVVKNGLYRKLHKCRFCPYTNIRSRNMQLHEMMHGPRESNHPLMKCPYCDYYVGSKGLLSHHMKVHQKNYGDTPENDAGLVEMGESVENDDESDQDIPAQQKVDTLLQISRFKRFGCERCPYASAKRQHFVRHLELHGSRQRYTCQYCDYSVPSNNLLLQHTKLHLMPNQNLLASQSVTNLQHLGEVPADVALASALPPADSDAAVTISVIHDHLALYENSIYDPEPKKLYRCDRCPYANVRRDYLLSHLKFHMVPSALVCPYCDYSAPKQALLTQHIRVHFCPLPELSDWLLENGQMEREASHRNLDLAEALKVAHEFQNQSKKKDKGKAVISGSEKMAQKDEKPDGKENVQDKSIDQSLLTYICQYCDREFPASDKLVKHELQHLIGNHFEATLQAMSAGQQQQHLEHHHHEQQQQEILTENHYNDEEESGTSSQDISTIPAEDIVSYNSVTVEQDVCEDSEAKEMEDDIKDGGDDLNKDSDSMSGRTSPGGFGRTKDITGMPSSDKSVCERDKDDGSGTERSDERISLKQGSHDAVAAEESGGLFSNAEGGTCVKPGVWTGQKYNNMSKDEEEVGKKCKSTYEFLKEIGKVCKISTESGKEIRETVISESGKEICAGSTSGSGKDIGDTDTSGSGNEISESGISESRKDVRETAEEIRETGTTEWGKMEYFESGTSDNKTDDEKIVVDEKVTSESSQESHEGKNTDVRGDNMDVDEEIEENVEGDADTVRKCDGNDKVSIDRKIESNICEEGDEKVLAPASSRDNEQGSVEVSCKKVVSVCDVHLPAEGSGHCNSDSSKTTYVDAEDQVMDHSRVVNNDETGETESTEVCAEFLS